MEDKEFKETKSLLENILDFSVGWSSEDGLSESHKRRILESAKGIQIIVATTNEMLDLSDSDNRFIGKMIKELGFDNPIEMANYLIVHALVASFQMGRASMKGEK